VARGGVERPKATAAQQQPGHVEFHPRFEALMSETAGAKPRLSGNWEESKPPFAILADRAPLFLDRSRRLATPAPGREPEPCPGFPADVRRRNPFLPGY
jgi:hypothetical protein